jgi:hypothetical protein
MSPAQIQEPWDRYNRVPLRAGWTYPLGQSGIRDALTAAEARVVRLGLGGGWSGLHLFAVASDQARAANADRGEWWQASDHELVVLFQDGVVRRTER